MANPTPSNRPKLAPGLWKRDPVAPGFNASMIFFHRLQEVMGDPGKVPDFGVEKEAADFRMDPLMVAFEGEHIVGVSLPDFASDFLLGAHGVEGDDAIGQLQSAQ